MATEREYFYRISSLYPPKHLHLRAMKRSQLNLLGVQIQPYTQKLSSTATTLPLPSSPITLTAAWWTPIPPRSPQRHRSVPVPLCWHEQCKIASGWVFSSSEWCFSNVSCPLCLQHCSTQVAPLGYKKEGKRSPIISRILTMTTSSVGYSILYKFLKKKSTVQYFVYSNWILSSLRVQSSLGLIW